MKKKQMMILTILVMASVFAVTVHADTGDVSAVIESTWTSAATQIKTVVNSVVFPALDMILTIAFFIKVGSSYFDYRQHGQIQWAPPIILFVCLVFTLTAPNYIWSIVGI